LYERYYPDLSLTETTFELFNASRIWLLDSHDKSLAEYEVFLVLTPWITGKELKWLRDNYSKKFVVIISTFMGLPGIQKLYKKVFNGHLNESGLNWMIIDLSREKEVYEMIVNARPKLFDELITIVKGGGPLPPPDRPKLEVRPNSYDFTDVRRGAMPSTTFTVENIGEGTLEWEVQDIPDWLDVSQTSGTNEGSFTVTVESDMLGGDQDGTVEVISNGGNESIAVSVNIVEDIVTPPPLSDLKILLGKDTTEQEIFWEPKKEINWSFVIVGSAGTGKTQTVKAVLSEFVKSKLPYIIFDFRNDYISKAKESEFGQILDLNTISINPLELDGNNTPKDQKYQISDIVDLVYNIGERQVGHIRSAIKHSYENKGIKEEDEDGWRNVPPTFDDIQNNLGRLSEEGDSGTRSSIKGIFARLDPIFDYGIFSAKTVMPFEDIMKGQTLVNLGTLPNDNLKAVVCEFFMRKLRYYLDKIGESRDPRLYVIIDEAHRLKYEREASAGQLLKEARKYGVGMLLATQDPVDFTDVVYNNIGGIMSLQLTDPKYAKTIAEHLGGKVTWKNVKNDLSSKFSAFVKFSQNPDAIRFDVIPYYKR